MAYKVTITWEGLDGAIERFTKMGEQLNSNLENQADAMANDGKDAWGAVTPVRSGRLKGGNTAEAGGLEVTFSNSVRYYGWVSDGHRTPSYFHRHGRIVPAKHQSFVAGKHITEKFVESLEGIIEKHLQKAIDELGD